MRSPIAAFCVATLFFLLAVPVAQAAPIEVDLRIEGETETLFEGPILSDVHKVKSLIDSQWRRCNGINVNTPWNTVPGVVPTSASADAMRIVDEPFDGVWYQQYEDYFVTQWGPDRQDEANAEYWGIVVNNVFTNIGGCQYQLDGDDEVLWVYNAFNGRSRLALYPASYSAGALPLTATATLNQPFEVEVDAWPGYSEGVPPASPQRSTTPFEGAVVAPVISSSAGFQKVDVESEDTVITAANGKASVTFTEPGWHRIKATEMAIGIETVIRSNRLDVCVPQPPATGCGALPAEDQVRTPPPPVDGEEEEQPEEPQPKGPDPSDPLSGGEQPPPPALGDRVSVSLKALDKSRAASGLVGVGWTVVDAGVGIGKWTISSKTLGRKGASFLTRASGQAKTSARVRLPRGKAYKLRISFVDLLGRGSSAVLGTVWIPG